MTLRSVKVFTQSVMLFGRVRVGVTAFSRLQSCKQYGSSAITLSCVTPGLLSRRCLKCDQQSHHLSTERAGRHVYPLFLKAEEHADRTAIVDDNGTYTYRQILRASHLLSDIILETLDCKESMQGDSIAVLTSNSVAYTICKWAAWISGAKVVPLCKTHPPSEWKYFIEDAQCKLILATDEFADGLRTMTADKSACPFLVLKKDIISSFLDITDLRSESDLKTLADRQQRFRERAQANELKNNDALIVYTSGTTGRPKVGILINFIT